jgi:hypothetical protein
MRIVWLIPSSYAIYMYQYIFIIMVSLSWFRLDVNGNALSPSLFDVSAIDLPPPPSLHMLGDLLHVQIQHRHGDRAPVHVAPAMAHVWEQSGLRPGQLSPIGTAQLASLGRFMRRIYMEESDFLPTAAGSAISIRSTDVDRCLQSVHSLLDELYPDTMLPVHTMPEEHERLLQPTDKCPSYLVAYRGILGELDELLQRQLSAIPTPSDNGKSNLLASLVSESGYGSQLLPANLVTIMTDNIFCMHSHGLHIPIDLHSAYPLLHNKTAEVYFHKFSPLHVRRAWARSEGRDMTLADEAFLTTELDPRGTVGGVLLRHIVHHAENVLHAKQQQHEIDSAPKVTDNTHAPVVNARTRNRSTDRTLLTSEEDFSLSSIWSSESAMIELQSFTRRRPLQARPNRSQVHNTPSLDDPLSADAPISATSRITPTSALPDGSQAKPRRRRKYKSGASIAKLAAEKLQIYSAHDSTIISVMQSLGLITSPNSEYLLPPYGASITFELRQRGGSEGGLFINAFYGFPLPVKQDNPTGMDGWQYHRHPLALRCPDMRNAKSIRWDAPKQWQCPFDAFKAYVQFSSRGRSVDSDVTAAESTPVGHAAPSFAGSSQIYAADDGCCVRTAAFHALGCDVVAPIIPFSSPGTIPPIAPVPTELESECVAFRQRCPATACPTGYILNPVSLACVAISHSHPSTQHDTIEVAAAVAEAGIDLPAHVPINAGGEAVALLPQPQQPLTPTHNQPSYKPFILLSLGCLLIGFTLGVVYTRRLSSRFHSREKDEYSMGGNNINTGQSERESFLTRNAAKRKQSPQLQYTSLTIP